MLALSFLQRVLILEAVSRHGSGELQVAVNLGFSLLYSLQAFITNMRLGALNTSAIACAADLLLNAAATIPAQDGCSITTYVRKGGTIRESSS